ncbi:helix-turn-helix transcriptional regulator [Desulfuromonas sp. AOP6]|uniref:helix-turn-helix domain-containing protein n=1 Tax=Desulfuromonas sp. AOP6 TaxID=1566351 RepID=UPI001BCF6DD5
MSVASLEIAFGTVLKGKRAEAKLSQEALALQCGLDRTYISLLERGLRQPSLRTLFLICEALRIRPSTLVSEVEKAVIACR